MNMGLIREKPLLLMVDDVPNNLQVLGNILATEDYEIEAATSGEHALLLAEKNLPDLILLDVMMPVLDGFEVCRRLKSKAETKEIPIIFITARTETEDVVEGLKLGAVDYVTKPFNSYELLARVKTHLELQRRAAALTQLNNERNELLHIMCHDLTNSIGAIEVIMRMLHVYPESESLKEDVINAARNGRELIDLVRYIRALEEQKIRLGPVLLWQSVNDSLAILRTQLQQKNIRVDLAIDEAIRVHAERSSLTNSVFNNLLTNAIKFSHTGSCIHVSAEPAADACVLVRVADEGIGIPASILENIFDFNKSVSRLGTDGEEGTGFGMPMVKKFVTFYGGQVDITSVVEGDRTQACGTTVLLNLPLCKPLGT